MREKAAFVGVASVAAKSADAGALADDAGISMDGGGAWRLNVRFSASTRPERFPNDVPF